MLTAADGLCAGAAAEDRSFMAVAVGGGCDTMGMSACWSGGGLIRGSGQKRARNGRADSQWAAVDEPRYRIWHRQRTIAVAIAGHSHAHPRAHGSASAALRGRERATMASAERGCAHGLCWLSLRGAVDLRGFV